MTEENGAIKKTAPYSQERTRALGEAGQLIRLGDLVVGSVYELRSRNLLCGVWTGETFIGVREGFGVESLDSEGDFEQGGSAIPLRLIGKIDGGILLREYLAPVCRLCGINTADDPDGAKHIVDSPECPRPQPALQPNWAMLGALQDFRGESFS